MKPPFKVTRAEKKAHYEEHVRKHTGERPYPCTSCPYASKSKSDLNKHMATHAGLARLGHSLPMDS